MARLGLHVLVVLTLSIVLSAGCRFFGGKLEHQWDTGAEARAAGAIAAGRLPSFVPDDATNVRERRDLSTGALWVRFDVPVAGKEAVLGACSPVAPMAVTPAAPARGIGWWPTMLRENQSDAEAQFDYARCDGRGRRGWLAAHRTLPVMFYWEPGA